MIKLKKLLSEALNPRRYSEIKGQAKYLAMEMKTLNKGIKSKNLLDLLRLLVKNNLLLNIN